MENSAFFVMKVALFDGFEPQSKLLFLKCFSYEKFTKAADVTKICNANLI